MGRGFQSYINHMGSWGLNVIIEDVEIIQPQDEKENEVNE